MICDSFMVTRIFYRLKAIVERLKKEIGF